jgi:hypothetical protein
MTTLHTIKCEMFTDIIHENMTSILLDTIPVIKLKRYS